MTRQIGQNRLAEAVDALALRSRPVPTREYRLP
jgi:hypothetical protein